MALVVVKRIVKVDSFESDEFERDWAFQDFLMS
jgi:hypothetical protein